MKSSALSQLARRTGEPPISWLMKMTLDRPELISLAAGFTDNESLPVRDARDLLDAVLGSPKTGGPALQYGSTPGDATLRRLTAGHLAALDGASKASSVHIADRTLITHGSQQLLYMTTEALCDPGDIVLVEDPTYFVYLGILQSHALRARGVRLTADGLDLAYLEAVLESLKRSGDLPRVKILYLVTYHQNPTGLTTSFAKKLGALELLRRYERFAGHPIYLLEDAAYRELRFAGDDVKSALATKFSERVIYAGTYSKPFATGARVGFGLLPEPVLTAVRRIKGNHDFGTANLLQQLLASALGTSRYETHVGELRERYARKAAVMVRAICEHFPPNIAWDEPRGGLYVWARLPRKIKSGAKSKLFQAALAHDVLYVPGELCYASDPTRARPNHEMRLSFGGASLADISHGIERLGQVLRSIH